MNRILITVIVPVYKVERFIERCVCSLLEQTQRSVEFLFVDDCSPDGSISVLSDVLSRYPDRKDDCRILSHDENKGLPAARNTGLAAARGDYVFHCDSDDWVEPDMLEKMYSIAKVQDADIVWSDFYISFEKNERYMRARDYRTINDLVKKGYLCGDMKYNVWNKLVKRSLYEGIEFPSGHSMGEDMTMILVSARAQKVAYAPEAFYHYVKLNNNSFTQVMSERNLEDMKFNASRVETMLKNMFPGVYDEDIEVFKLNVKLPFLMSDRKADYLLWEQWFPESNKYCFGNSELPARTKVLQWMAAHRCWWYVWLYYKLVYKFIYGVIYR